MNKLKVYLNYGDIVYNNTLEEEKSTNNDIELNQDFRKIREELYELFDVRVLNSELKITTKKKTLFEAKCFDDLILNRAMIEKKKNEVDMKESLQVDTNCENLQTNAPIRILIKKSKKSTVDFPEAGESNMYVVEGWSEALDLLKFFNLNREFIKDI